MNVKGPQSISAIAALAKSNPARAVKVLSRAYDAAEGDHKAKLAAVAASLLVSPQTIRNLAKSLGIPFGSIGSRTAAATPEALTALLADIDAEETGTGADAAADVSAAPETVTDAAPVAANGRPPRPARAAS